jgi:starch synthase (maltosyl-transferring)
MAHGPRIYNLFPLLCGSVRQWEDHLPRIAAMGFDWVYVNPFHYPGFSGSLYAVKDYYRINDLMWDGESSLEDLLSAFCSKARDLGLSVIMDLVINHTGKDSLLAGDHPEWFLHEADGSLRSPRAIDPADTRKVTVWGDLAEINYHNPAHHAGLVAYFGQMMAHFVDCGVRGFRCDAAYLVPPEVWSSLITQTRSKRHDATFFAETLGCRLDQVSALHSSGFDYLFNSARWWDFKSPWLLEQYNAFRSIAPSISFPESHDTERLASELGHSGYNRDDPLLMERAYRMHYMFSAIFSTAVMIPVGFEYGFRGRLNVVDTRPEHWERPLFDISDYIAEVNHMRAAIPALNEEGTQRQVHLGNPAITCLLRRAQEGPSWVLSLINTDLHNAQEACIGGLDSDTLLAREVTPGGQGQTIARGDVLLLPPGAVRVFANT